MERLYPAPVRVVDPESVHRDLDWPQPPAERPHVALNMVTSVDGRAVFDARAHLIGSRTDHQVMRQIRANADAVMVGAGTLRAENVNPSVPEALEALRLARGLSPQPLAVVVSGSAALPLDRTFFQSTRFQRVVLTCQGTPESRLQPLRAIARVLVAGDKTPDLAVGLRLLRQDLGVRWLLVEGGPTLNAALLAAGVLDELFLTLAPRLLGGPERTMFGDLPLPAQMWRRLTVLSVHQHEHELFLRYRLQPQ